MNLCSKIWIIHLNMDSVDTNKTDIEEKKRLHKCSVLEYKIL